MHHRPGTRLTRRQFVMRSARSLVGVAALPGWSDFPPDKRKSVIFLIMSGGMSHLDTFDPKPDCPEVMGMTRTIGTAGGGMVGHHLPLTAGVMDRVCVIRSMRTHPARHSEAVAAMRRGWPATLRIARDDDPWAENRGGDMELERLRQVDLTNQRFHPDFQQHCGLTGNVDLPEKYRRALDLSREPGSVRKLYGAGRFAADCLSARRLVQCGARAVEVELGGWDTHVDHFTGIAGRCREFDQPFAALITDLEQSGMLRDTLVVVATEFGRSPAIQIEHRYGRDHHTAAFSCMLAGAGVPGGMHFGSTDASGSKVLENPVTFDELNAAIAGIQAGDAGSIFQGPKNSGPPMTAI